jgi:hypothetical protein
MSAMLDTMILVYGSQPSAPQSSPDRAELIQSSKILLRNQQPLRVSAVVAAEFLPMVRSEPSASCSAGWR